MYLFPIVTFAGALAVLPASVRSAGREATIPREAPARDEAPRLFYDARYEAAAELMYEPCSVWADGVAPLRAAVGRAALPAQRALRDCHRPFADPYFPDNPDLNRFLTTHPPSPREEGPTSALRPAGSRIE